MNVSLNGQQMARAFNEWMRRYTDAPEQFEREFQTVAQFQKEQTDGVEPSYGETSASYLASIAAELEGGDAAAPSIPPTQQPVGA